MAIKVYFLIAKCNFILSLKAPVLNQMSVGRSGEDREHLSFVVACQKMKAMQKGEAMLVTKGIGGQCFVMYYLLKQGTNKK